jgi:hypothetical protein
MSSSFHTCLHSLQFDAHLDLQDIELTSETSLEVAVLSPSGGPSGTSLASLSIPLSLTTPVVEGRWYTLHPEGEIYLALEWTPSQGSADASGEEAAAKDVLSKLEGPRHGLLRMEQYYNFTKGAYCAVASLPVLRSIVPVFEGIVESVLNVTPLHAPPEEGAKGHPTTALLDSRIDSALSGADSAVDKKKDEALAGLRSLMSSIRGLKPKNKSVLDVTKDTVVGTTQGMTNFVGGIFGSIFDHIQSLASGVKGAVVHSTQTATSAVGSMVEGTKHNVEYMVKGTKHNVGTAVEGAKGAVGGAVDGAKGVVGGAVEGAKGAVGGAASAVKSTVDGAVATVASTASSVKSKAFGSPEVVTPEVVPVSAEE